MPVKNPLFQEERINYLANVHGTEQWVTLYSDEKETGMYGGLSSCLIPPRMLTKSMQTTDWDLDAENNGPGIIIHSENGKQIATYYRITTTGAPTAPEPLFHLGRFRVNGNFYAEMCEEFRLFHNIFYNFDSKKYVILNHSGDEEEAIRVSPNRLEVLNKLLQSYIAAKQMHLLLLFEYTRHMPVRAVPKYGPQDYELRLSESLFHLERWTVLPGRNSHGESEIYSVIRGKKAILCGNIEECGMEPYLSPENYQEFKIGIDEKGKDINHTCDPKKLSNHIGKNPRTPHYLTPVYFQREVLGKYYDNPSKYSVEDGLIRCGSWWSCQVDNNHPDYVSVFIGDLGRNLPESERAYWLSFNISPQEGISRTNFRRSFCGEFADPELADHLFKQNYRQFRLIWKKCMGWDLFKDLHEKDQYLLGSLHIPLSENQKEFDDQVLSLEKLLVESINGKAIASEIGGKLKGEKGISILERYLKQRMVPHYEEHSKFLRDLHKLRNIISAHLKGRDYEKALNQLGLSAQFFGKAFQTLLNKALVLLKDLLALVEDKNPQAQ